MAIHANSEAAPAGARGTIIKLPGAGPGLVFVDGAQLPFVVEGVWSSASAPALDQVVLVERDAAGTIVRLSVVNDAELARERVARLSGAAEQHARRAADLAQVGVGALSARMGRARLVAAVLLLLGWFLLPIGGVQIFGVGQSVTFWQLIGIDLERFNVNGSGFGLLSLLGLVAVASPFVAPFWRHPLAPRLNAVPLTFIVLVIAKAAWSLHGALGSRVAGSALEALFELIEIRYGTFVLLGASGFLAVQAFASSVVPSASGDARAAPSFAWLADKRVLGAAAGALLIAVAAVAIPRFAGASKGDFYDVIDAGLKASPQRSCWSLMRPVSAFPVRVMSGFGKDTAEHPILQGLVKGGYITVASSRGMLGQEFTVDLTPKGKEHAVWDPKAGFCVGQRRVHEVVRWTEPAAGTPLAVTQVTYTWTLGDQPSWVDEDDFKDVEGMSQPVEALALLRKTNDGWHTM